MPAARLATGSTRDPSEVLTRLAAMARCANPPKLRSPHRKPTLSTEVASSARASASPPRRSPLPASFHRGEGMDPHHPLAAGVVDSPGAIPTRRAAIGSCQTASLRLTPVAPLPRLSPWLMSRPAGPGRGGDRDRQRLTRDQHVGSQFGTEGGEPCAELTSLGPSRSIHLAVADRHGDDVDPRQCRRPGPQQEQPPTGRCATRDRPCNRRRSLRWRRGSVCPARPRCPGRRGHCGPRRHPLPASITRRAKSRKAGVGRTR